jgi:hypothetical protein
MKKFLFSTFLSIFLLSSLMVHASLQTYDAWVTATDIAKGGDKTYTGTIPVKYWGALNDNNSSQAFDPKWSPNAPPEKVSVIAVVEYRGFGYISGSLSSSHGNISISGVSIGEFKKGANGHAVPPNDSAPKNTYAFGTDPTDSPWRTASMEGTCSEYTSGEHTWSGSATMTIEGAVWMGTSTTSTGSSNTETEGESSSEGGSWAAVGSADVSVSDGTGKWIISVTYQSQNDAPHHHFE